MDKDLLVKQIVNEVESSYLSLASVYDLDAIEQLELLDLIESKMYMKLEALKEETKDENNLVYCHYCNKFYKIDECCLQKVNNKYERKSSLMDKGKEVRAEIVKKYEEVTICPEDHLIDRQWKKEYISEEEQKSLEKQWGKQIAVCFQQTAGK